VREQAEEDVLMVLDPWSFFSLLLFLGTAAEWRQIKSSLAPPAGSQPHPGHGTASQRPSVYNKDFNCLYAQVLHALFFHEI
jgi:hypothetical protein